MAAISHIPLSDAIAHNRFSAEFFDPKYVFKPRHPENWLPIGKILKSFEYGLSISMNSEAHGFPIFRMNEIENCFAQRPEKYADIPIALFKRYRLQENDVLFNRTNSFDFVGRTGIVKGQTDCTFASYLIRLIPNSNFILPEFLTIYLNTKFGIGQIKRRAMRSINQANVSASEIRRVLIPLIDLDEQERIAVLLNLSSEESKSGEKAFKNAEKILEAELGLDKTTFVTSMAYTARFSVTGLAETFEANRIDAQCFSPESVFYESLLSSDTECDRLGNLLSSSAKGRQQNEAAAGPTDYCSIKHISGREIVNAAKTSPGKGTPTAKPDDLLLAITGATIGKIGIVKRYEELVFSGDMLRLRANGDINPHYLLLVLNHHLGQVQFKRWITGSTNGHLSPRDVGRVLVPRLAPEKEAEIAALVEDSLRQRQESEKLLEQAKARVEQLIEEAVEA